MTDTVNYGRTPGFWKNHTEIWGTLAPPQVGDPDLGALSKIEDVFFLPGYDFGDTTLIAALNTGGGGVNALMRHGTAAYLNASVDGDVPGLPENNYLLWHIDVTSAVEYVLRDSTPVASEVEKLKNIFAYFNEAENGQLELDTGKNDPNTSFFQDVFEDQAQLRDLADDGADNDSWKSGGDLSDPKQYGWDDFLALTATQQFGIINDYLI